MHGDALQAPLALPPHEISLSQLPGTRKMLLCGHGLRAAAAGRRPSRCSSRPSVRPVRRPQASKPCAQRQRRFVAAASNFEASGPTTLQEAAALDELIDLMLSAGSQQELAGLVAQNIMAINTKFWMRIATRNDSAASAADKERLKSLADVVMVLVDTVMKQSEKQLSDSAATLQAILAAAADANGEWYLPLTKEQVAAVRGALERNAEALDEALLSNAFAYIKKASDDRFDSLVALLQKILQLYAAQALTGPETDGAAGFVNKLVYAEEHEWGPLLQEAISSGAIGQEAFTEALQRKMEAAVLGLQSGSYAQRVQAEYLKEVEGRAREAFEAAGVGSSGSSAGSS